MRPILCPRCDGKGKTVAFREREHIFMSWYTWQECAACQGTGYRRSRLDAEKNAFASVDAPLVSFISCFGPAPVPNTTLKRATLVTTVKL
jgi:hypothetical protein